MGNPIRLSICIATFNRGKFIGETLDSVLAQATPEVEVVVVDGASPDDTQQVVTPYLARFPQLRYIRESTNSGVDRDYDKAVGYARGDYCWLMTDDDLLVPGAVARVLAELGDSPDVVLVNAEVRTVDFSSLLHPRIIEQQADQLYSAHDADRLFVDTLQGLTFIGCVIIRRSAWLARDREPYFGSLFIHVGVIFQAGWAGKIKLVASPQILIRYGNAMWTPRGFEIWMFMWPKLVWSFAGFPDAAKARVSPREPWRDLKKLVVYRATGAYGLPQYGTCWKGQRGGAVQAAAWLIAALPARLVNLLASLHVLLFNRKARLAIYDLSRSTYAGGFSKFVARRLSV